MKTSKNFWTIIFVIGILLIPRILFSQKDLPPKTENIINNLNSDQSRLISNSLEKSFQINANAISLNFEDGDLIISDQKLGIFRFSQRNQTLNRMVWDNSGNTKFGDVEFTKEGYIVFLDEGIYTGDRYGKGGKLYLYKPNEGKIDLVYDFDRSSGGWTWKGYPEGISVAEDGRIYGALLDLTIAPDFTHEWGKVYSIHPGNETTTKTHYEQRKGYTAGYVRAVKYKNNKIFFAAYTLTGYYNGGFFYVNLNDNKVYNVNTEFLPYHSEAVTIIDWLGTYYYWVVVDNDIPYPNPNTPQPYLHLLHSDPNSMNEKGYKYVSALAHDKFGYLTDISVDKTDRSVYLADWKKQVIWKAAIYYSNQSIYPIEVFSGSKANPPLTKINAIFVITDIGSQISHRSTDLPPNRINLKQNYPNPFNSATSIHFSLDKQQIISLRIFNIKGEIIKTFIDKEKHNKGDYSYIWDGKDNNNLTVPSGTYIIELNTEKHTQICKAILLK